MKAESVSSSNDVIQFDMAWNNVNNIQAGCMGMCNDTVPYHCELQRHIPDQNRWVTVKSYPRQNGPAFQVLKQIFPITQICAGNVEN